MPWTTTDLLASVRRSGFLPDAHDLSSSDLLALAQEEVETLIAELWKTAREEFRVATEDVAITAGVQRYRVPRRAMYRGVRAITFVDSQGYERTATEVPAAEAWRFRLPPEWGADARYYFEGDEIVLLAVPTATGGYLRVRYYVRPPRLIEADETVATAILAAGSATTLTLASTPPASISTSGALVDIISGDSPFGELYTDRISAGFSSPTLSLSAATPIVAADISDITGGTAYGGRVDFVCPRDTTVYPPIPQEMHPVLVKATIRSALEALGDRVGAEQAMATLERRARAAESLQQPRNADRKPAIVARGGPLRSRGSHRSWWGR